MAHHDYQYLDLATEVMQHGAIKGDRTGTGTKSIFDWNMRFDLSDGSIPLLTTKKIHWKSIVHELLWYLSGDTNIKYLNDNGVRIWNEWADENGDLGPVYGYQWRIWPKYESVGWGKDEYDHTEMFVIRKYIDQIAQAVHKLKNNPDDRRIIVSAWNVADLEDMALPPCHYGFQLYTRPLTEVESKQWPDKHRKISMKMTQRSADVFLGVPFNIAQYAILLHMFAHVANMVPDQFTWTGGDVHIYSNHYDQVREQLTRTPQKSPTLQIVGYHDSLDDFKYEDFVLLNYDNPDPAIKGKVAV